MASAPDAGTVAVRVQVIDVVPLALDLVIPNYLPARDLTQRIAVDAQLGAYRGDGTRRGFQLRARGRVLADDERLVDLGVGDGELLQLLPEPPDNHVVEREPEYPITHPYVGAGWGNVLSGLLSLSLWTAGWAVALTAIPSLMLSWGGTARVAVLGVLPALGLALLATSFARHLLGGDGKRWVIPVLGLAVFAPLVVVAVVPAALLGVAPGALAVAVGLAAGAGIFGVMLGWLAWYGAVEPLPPPKVAVSGAVGPAVVTVPCAICGGPVTPDVLAGCRFGCGRAFHVGCIKARESVSTGSACAVCGFQPG
jgi:uncharacterized ubiquitin-like protein YukD